MTALDLRDVVRHRSLDDHEGVGTLDRDLAEVHQVEQADPLPDGPMLGDRALVLDRHEPAGERTELGAELPVLRLERSVLQRVVRVIHPRRILFIGASHLLSDLLSADRVDQGSAAA